MQHNLRKNLGIAVGGGIMVLAIAAAIWAERPPDISTPVSDSIPVPVSEPPRSRDAAEEAWVRGNVAMEREEFDQAFAAYEEALRQDDSFLLALVGRGNVRLARQDYDAALADFTAALERNPELADAYLSRGTTNWLLGRLFEAEGDFRRLTQMYPDNSFYAVRLSDVLHEAGKGDEAEEFFRAAYERNPQNDWALALWLGAVRARSLDALIERGQALYQQGVDRPALREAMGAAFLERRDFPAVITWLSPIVGADVAEVAPDSLQNLALAYFATGQLDACRSTMHDYMLRMGRSHQFSPAVCDGSVPS